MEAVTLTNISKRYGSVEALRGVSLSVAPGELFGIIGPDGAGKTSLFRILLPTEARLRSAVWMW